jgi:hypothetical protein
MDIHQSPDYAQIYRDAGLAGSAGRRSAKGTEPPALENNIEVL